MFCPRCGTTLPDGVRFCQKCGFEIAQNIPVPGPAVQLQQKKSDTSSTSAARAATSLLVRAVMLFGALVAAFLLVDFAKLIIDGADRVVDLVSLYDESTAMAGTAIFFIICVLFCSPLLGLVLMNTAVCLLSTGMTAKALKKSCRYAAVFFVTWVVVMLLGVLIDEPSLSYSDLQGPLYVITHFFFSWASDRAIPFAVSVLLPLIGLVVYSKAEVSFNEIG